MDLFTQIYSCLLRTGRPTTNKEIAKQTGQTEKRVADLKRHPNKATLAEMQIYADVFGCVYTVGKE